MPTVLRLLLPLRALTRRALRRCCFGRLQPVGSTFAPFFGGAAGNRSERRLARESNVLSSALFSHRSRRFDRTPTGRWDSSLEALRCPSVDARSWRTRSCCVVLPIRRGGLEQAPSWRRLGSINQWPGIASKRFCKRYLLTMRQEDGGPLGCVD